MGDAIPIAADRETERDSPKRPVHFRKDFVIGGNITSARLYITALGVYEAEINCQRVGDFLLAYGWQPYNHRHVYDTYDVTEPVSSGANTIGEATGIKKSHQSALVFVSLSRYSAPKIVVIVCRQCA